MINLLRKNQRGLMLIIAVLTIVSFIFFYNTAQLDELASVRNPRIYGKQLPQAAIDKLVKNYQLTLALGQFDLVSKLSSGATDENSALSEFVWNLIVLQHEARRMGVEPTNSQVETMIKGLPVFRTSNQFDPMKYAAFLRDQLAPRGFTERQLEEVMRDTLRLDRIRQIVESPVTVGEKELRDAAKVLQPVKAQFVRFDAAEAAKSTTVSPEEIAGYFERNQQSLNTSEKRSVNYVAFELPPDTKLEGKEKVDALQSLAAAATKFLDSLASTTFEDAAAAAGKTVQSTPAFDRNANVPDAQPADSAKTVPTGIAPTAFLIPAVGKTSDIIQAGDAFYVLQLTSLNPARPLTLAEATPQLEAGLRNAKAAQSLQNSAEDKIQSLREALASGKSFADAATSLGLKAEPVSSLPPMDEKLPQDQRPIVAASLPLKDGEISAFEQAPWGGFAVYLESRAPLDETEFQSHQNDIESGILDNKRAALFNEWLRVSRDAANLVFPKSPRG